MRHPAKVTGVAGFRRLIERVGAVLEFHRLGTIDTLLPPEVGSAVGALGFVTLILQGAARAPSVESKIVVGICVQVIAELRIRYRADAFKGVRAHGIALSILGSSVPLFLVVVARLATVVRRHGPCCPKRGGRGHFGDAEALAIV